MNQRTRVQNFTGEKDWIVAVWRAEPRFVCYMTCSLCVVCVREKVFKESLSHYDCPSRVIYLCLDEITLGAVISCLNSWGVKLRKRTGEHVTLSCRDFSLAKRIFVKKNYNFNLFLNYILEKKNNNDVHKAIEFCIKSL